MTAVCHMFARQAAATPDAVAIADRDGQLCYRELAARADRITGCLRQLGAGPENLIGVAVDRHAGLVAALLGILGAGAAYLPLDPAFPAMRLAAILSDAGTRLVLVDGNPPEWLPAQVTAVPLTVALTARPARPVPVRPESLAYAIYTSGSTGRPKGVMIPHRALANLLISMRARPGLTAQDILVAVTTVSFDIAALELFLPLITGARLVLASRTEVADPVRLSALIKSSGGTVLQATPAAWQMLRESGWHPPAEFTVLCGGERLPADLAAWMIGLHEAACWDMYGPTETTIWSSTERLGGDYAPVTKTAVHVLDDKLRPTVTGELYIGGVGLSRGYIGRPALTAERFVPDPHGPPGTRLYRTGDVARRRKGGSVEILGRTDHQVKIRGFRVELSEIEAVLTDHSAVQQAVVHPVPSPTGETMLAAYIVADGRPSLREHAARRLPDYMIPAAFVFLDSLPLTPNGKIDRTSLPAPVVQRPAGHTPTRTDTERIVARIWADVFGRETIGINDDFIEIGGHSLLAVQIMIRIRESLGVEVSLSTLLECPTPAGHAALAEAGRIATRPIEPVARGGDLAVSTAQRGLWFTEQASRGTASFSTNAAYRIAGRLDVAALQTALTRITERHEVLRTVFLQINGTPVQRVMTRPGYELKVREARTEEEAQSLLQVEARAPFNLSTGPLMRVLVVQKSAREQLLLFHWHHIVMDGWSQGVFLRELAQLCSGQEPAPLPIQYADYSAWECSQDRASDYWLDRLADAPPEVSPLPDRPRPEAASGHGGHLYVDFPESLWDSLASTSIQMRCTPFMALLAAFSLLLSRYGANTDVVVGVPFAGRSRRELENLIGFFVNILVLRVDVSGSPTVGELIARTRDAVLGANEHPYLPFEQLVRDLSPERRPGRHPIFQVMLNLEDQEPGVAELAGLALTEIDVESGAARYDLAFTVKRSRIEVEYATDLFDAASADHIACHYIDLLTAIAAASPGDDASGLALPAEAVDRVHDLVAAQARRTPGAVAVETDGGALSYRELNRHANFIARRLRARGVRPDEPVAVLLPPGEHLIIALLAVLKSGAAYLPLDPAHPASRRAAIVKATGAQMTLTEDDIKGLVGDAGDLPALTGSDALAYVISTSGSTGVPKNVALSHRALVNLIRWHTDRQLSGVRTAHMAPPAFDISFQEIFITLASGGRVVVAPADVRFAPAKLANWIEQHRIEAIITTPTMLDLVARQWQQIPNHLAEVIVCGEQFVVTPAHRRVLAKVSVHNQYGPTETQCATAYPCPAGVTGSPPIGRPISGLRLYVLDASLRRLPHGAYGEIFIGGQGVARGYLNAPGPTAERFLPDPFTREPGARMYRTGDLGYIRGDGEVVFLGRADEQVKLRGVRIEPAEVEAALASHPGVRAAAVAIRDSRLVAYIVASPAREPKPGTLRLWLRNRLPDSMIPSQYVVIDELPRSSNGKLRRDALPVPVGRGICEDYAPPQTSIEKLIADAWTEVLEIDHVGVHDDFFMVGGHSLLASQIAARLRVATGADVTMRDVLEKPTVATLAGIVNQRAVAPPGIVSVKRVEPTPLSSSQRGLWFIDQLHPGNCAYHLSEVLHVRGALDFDALRHALTEIVARHEVLRTTYPLHDNGPVQSVRPPEPVEFPLVDLGGRPLEDLIAEASWRPFELTSGPVMRAEAIQCAAKQYVLVFTVHHIASDGWSMSLLDRELTRLYAGEKLPPLPIQYADFATWEQSTPLPHSRLDYWNHELGGLRALNAGTDRERPAVWDDRAGLVSFVLAPPLADAARKLARDAGATLFIVLLAAYALVLARRSGQSDFVIGTPAAGRDVPEVERLIGCFVNTLPLRVTVEPEATFAALLRSVRQKALAAYAAQVPFAQVVAEVRPPRDLSRHPLVDVMFVLNKESLPELSSLKTTALPVITPATGFDLSLEIKQQLDGSLKGELMYAAALFDNATATRICRSYHRLLAAVCAEPDRPHTMWGEDEL